MSAIVSKLDIFFDYEYGSLKDVILGVPLMIFLTARMSRLDLIWKESKYKGLFSEITPKTEGYSAAQLTCW